MPEPSISVIIPTHDRRELLANLFASIAAQDFPLTAIEVIVVCDGCTDATIPFLRSAVTPFALRFIETPGMGAAYARHQGALLALAPLLIFLDDDIDPSPQLFSLFYSTIQHKDEVGIGYLVLEEDGDTSWNRLYLNNWWEKHFHELTRADHEPSFEDITSGGLCLYRSFYLEVGGFDTRFKCREDYELGYRLLTAGARFRFSKMFLGIHRDRVSDQQRLHRRKELEGYWDVEMVRKHPALWSALFLRAIYFTKGWKRWFLWLAFYAPCFGKAMFRFLYRRQQWMERNHFRIMWLNAEARQHRFHYALGLADQFNTISQFNEWVDAIQRDFPIEEKHLYDQLYFANRWLVQHGQPLRLLAEPFRRFLAMDYFKAVTQNNARVGAILRMVSIVVCTRDRTDLLKGCLEALFAIDYPYKEIIIVDNAPSSDACFVWCRDLPVRYIVEPKQGLDNARNTGIQHAHGDIIAFTDDDARVDKDWLNNIVLHFDDARVMCVTGYVAAWSLETKAERLFEFSYGGMGHGFKTKRFDGKRMSSFQKLKASGMGVGANMAFRKEWFALGGYFDPLLDVGTPSAGGGDVEMFHRVVARGLVVVYDPSVIVWHMHRKDMQGLKRQIYMNGRSYYYYLTTVFKKRTVPQWAVIGFMLRYWIWGWMGRNMLFKSNISRQLLLIELKGLIGAMIDLQGRHLQGRHLQGRHLQGRR